MRYPIAYPTVDIIVVREHNGKQQIILGKKPGADKWCFPGGFVDPTDLDFEAAARRELSEEVTGIEVSNMIYIGSSKIDDERYQNGPDGIMTSIFVTSWEEGDPVAGDDLEQVQWFNEDDILPHLVNKHKIIFKIFQY